MKREAMNIVFDQESNVHCIAIKINILFTMTVMMTLMMAT